MVPAVICISFIVAHLVGAVLDARRGVDGLMLGFWWPICIVVIPTVAVVSVLVLR